MQGSGVVQGTEVTRPDGSWFIDPRPDLAVWLGELAAEAGYRLRPIIGVPVWGGVKVAGSL